MIKVNYIGDEVNDKESRKEYLIRQLGISMKNMVYENGVDVCQVDWFDGIDSRSNYESLVLGDIGNINNVNVGDIVYGEVYLLIAQCYGEYGKDRYDYFLTLDDGGSPKLIDGLHFKYSNFSTYKGLCSYYERYKEIQKYKCGDLSYADVFEFISM